MLAAIERPGKRLAYFDNRKQMAVYLLNDEPIFPDPLEAEPDGLIAIGGDLSIPRLISAYSQGIFPWFEEQKMIFWYSPNPRLVLFPDKLKVSSSLRRTIKSNKFEVRIDSVFRKVISGCAKVGRSNGGGTWISRSFINAYTAMHKAGFAHSFETFYEGKLVGGLYGLSLGSVFFGESMFFTMSDASKVAFYHLVRFAREKKFAFIDCQQETEHMMSLGAESIPREDFLMMLERATDCESITGRWKF
jgi:leucyl/phenylalanyl-tRNA--protein transferase